MSFETSAHDNRKQSSNVISFFKILPVAALFIIAGRFVTRHRNGENVDSSLNTLCEELEKRSDFTFPGCHITGTKSEEVQFGADPGDTSEFITVQLPLIIIFTTLLAMWFWPKKSPTMAM